MHLSYQKRLVIILAFTVLGILSLKRLCYNSAVSSFELAESNEEEIVLDILKEIPLNFEYTEPIKHAGLVGAQRWRSIWKTVNRHFPEHVPLQVKQKVAKLLLDGQREQIKHGFCGGSPPEKQLNSWDKYFQGFPPVVGCELIVRVGAPQDGGKYVCNPQLLSFDDRRCVVYSFGSASNFWFDNDMRDMFGCRVRTFDPTIPIRDDLIDHHYTCLGPVASKNPFPDWNLLDKRGEVHRCDSLPQIVESLGDQVVDVLKVDIERSEMPFLRYLMIESGVSYLHNLGVKIFVVEYHGKGWNDRFPQCVALEEIVELLDMLESAGYYMYMAEHNVNSRAGIEFAFIHKDLL